MGRGRKRKPDPSIPAHIDQAALPAGMYWDRSGAGRWFVLERAESGKPRRKTVAGPKAKLSDLHALAESAAGAGENTLRWLCEAYEASPKFRALAKSSRDSYAKARKVALATRTKLGGTFGELETRRITRPVVQRLVDLIAAGHERDDAGNLVATPTKAVHVLRYLSVVFRWGANRGHCDGNPAEGVEAPIERKHHVLPTHEAFTALLDYARKQAHQGHGVRGQEGGCPPYLAPAAEIAYLCRLRGIEVTTLTDANALPEGLLSNRRKGSRDNITAWSPRLRAAWDALTAYRSLVWKRRRQAIPLDPAARPLIVTIGGDAITKSAFDSAWHRMVNSAIATGVIRPDQRFSMHSLKHRGVTDTPGTDGEKQLASGHKSLAMVAHYNHEVPTVAPAPGAKGSVK
jgi:hypothetical protein